MGEAYRVWVGNKDFLVVMTGRQRQPFITVTNPKTVSVAEQIFGPFQTRTFQNLTEFQEFAGNHEILSKVVDWAGRFLESTDSNDGAGAFSFLCITHFRGRVVELIVFKPFCFI